MAMVVSVKAEQFVLYGHDVQQQIDLGDFIELKVNKLTIDGYHECTLQFSCCAALGRVPVRAKLPIGAQRGRTYSWVIYEKGVQPRLNEIK